MSVDRIERVNALLRREIGEALYKVFIEGTINLACITVTSVDASRNLRHATVRVSILGHEGERGTIMERLRSKAPEIQSIINRNMNLKYTPRLRFVFDGSIAKGDQVLSVLSKLDIPEDTDDDEVPGVVTEQ